LCVFWFVFLIIIRLIIDVESEYKSIQPPSKTVGVVTFLFLYYGNGLISYVDGDYPDISLNSGPRRNGLAYNYVF